MSNRNKQIEETENNQQQIYAQQQKQYIKQQQNAQQQNVPEQIAGTECVNQKHKNCRNTLLKAAIAVTALTLAFVMGYGTHSAVVNRLYNNYAINPTTIQQLDNAGQPIWYAPDWQMKHIEKLIAAMPQIDSHETAKQVIVTANLPTIKKENLKVKIDGQTLLISAEQEKDKVTGQGQQAQEQRDLSTFQATMPLPQKIIADRMQTNFENGVLTVSIPKA